MKTISQYSRKDFKLARKAAQEYLLRRNRHSHPEGEFDSAKRWYPDESEKLETSLYRSPSRAWPFTYMKACRSQKHCIALFNADSKLVNKVIKQVKSRLDDNITVDDLSKDQIIKLVKNAKFQ